MFKSNKKKFKKELKSNKDNLNNFILFGIKKIEFNKNNLIINF